MVSCGPDNQGIGSICSSLIIMMLKSTSVNRAFDSYVVVLGFLPGNTSLGTYFTQISAKEEFAGGSEITGLMPQGCPSGQDQQFSIDGWTFPTANACTQSSILLGTSTEILTFDQCGPSLNCPYLPITQNFSDFAVEVDVPKNSSLSLSLHAILTVGVPGACCLNDRLATNELTWSSSSGINSVSAEPPAPAWRGDWYLLALAIAGVALAAFLVLKEGPEHLRKRLTAVQRPTGVALLAILNVAIGSIVLLIEGLRFPFSNIQGISLLTEVIPYLLIGVLLVLTGVGLWNGHEWARIVTIFSLLVAMGGSVLTGLPGGPAEVGAFISIVINLLTIVYLTNSRVKAYFARTPGELQNPIVTV
jgi:hypothetical protein